MTSDEHRDSLADQAAAWVPPWERAPVSTAPQRHEAEPEARTEPQASVAAEVSPEPEASADESAATPADEPVASEPVTALPLPRTPGEDRPSDVPVPEPAGRAESEPAARDGVPDSSDPALIDDAEFRGALEAILLVVDEPVAEIVLAQVLEQPTERVAAMLRAVAADYTAAGHGFELRRVAGGWRLYTRPEYASYVERFVLDGQSVRLTQAALETLAVVAYKQPVTRSRVSAIRGVNCDGVIRTLVTRGLIEECGTEPESGAFLYRTTTLFLEKLGLNTVDELPPLAPFLPDNVEEIADAQR
ncbi:SMC-Scp complex subunit ScpB [Micromonospora sp. NPDC049679]|uniref:SMC-Scp complex subunit ScpB n=1 Tax=Micromonospora sp. NPDC049679 TaxID=3155920 RepID=UPI0033E7D8B8